MFLQAAGIIWPAFRVGLLPIGIYAENDNNLARGCGPSPLSLFPNQRNRPLVSTRFRNSSP